MVEVCANANIFSPGPVSAQITLRDKDGGEVQTEVDLREVKLITVELDSLQDGAIILMGEKELAGSLTPNTKSLLP